MRVLFVVFITLLWWYVSVLIHELGHLCGALLVRWKPLIFTLGTRHRRTIFRIGDLHFMMGVNLFSGFVHASPRDQAHFRLKKLIFIAGGPFATAIVAFVTWAALVDPNWNSHLPDWLSDLLPAFLMIEASILFGTVFPLTCRLEKRTSPNDGKMFFQTLFMKRSDIAKRFLEHCYWQIRTLVRENRIDEARVVTLEKTPSTPDLLGWKTLWIYFLIEAGKNAEAEREISTLLDENVDTEEVVSRLDIIAGIPLFYGIKAFLDRALEYIDRAIALAPDKITLKGTKGGLLIEKGMLDEGIRMLECVLAETDSANDKAISEYYLAFAYDKKGHKTQMAEHWNRALALDPKCSVRRRLEPAIFSSKTDTAAIPQQGKL